MDVFEVLFFNFATRINVAQIGIYDKFEHHARMILRLCSVTITACTATLISSDNFANVKIINYLVNKTHWGFGRNFFRLNSLGTYKLAPDGIL